MNPAEQAAHAYCSVLFADLDGDLGDHLVTVLSLPGPTVRWLPVNDSAAIATAVREADARPGAGAVYLSMGLARPGTPPRKPDGKLRRAEVDDIGAIGGAWADIDVRGPGHTKESLPPDERSAMRILDACGLAPTMVWRTGGGLQCYWKFTEALVLDTAADRERARTMLRNWNITLAMHAHRLGRWQVDTVFDLARVLRPAGTTNRKIDGDPRRVEIISADGPTYEPDDLIERTAEQEYLDKFEGMGRRTDGGGTVAVDLLAVWRMVNSAAYRARGYTPEWLETLIDEGMLGARDKIVKVFTKGHDSGDDSTTDASLARLCADLGLDERDAVEMIMCRRLAVGAKLDKIDPHRRTSYLVLTVDKVFASAKAKAQKLAADAADAKAAIAAQDASAAGNARPVSRTPDALTRAAASPSGARGLGGAMVADLGDTTNEVRPDPAAPTDAPPAGSTVEQSTPVVEEPTPAVEEPVAEPDPADDEPAAAPTDDAAEPVMEAEQETDRLVADDDPVIEAEAPTVTRPITGAARSSWGTRTESQNAELEALSKTLLGAAAKQVRIWRCQYRGRGAKQERRLVLRVDPTYVWPGVAPEGYVPGLPFTTGWYPAGVFVKLGGWLTALRQDALLVTSPVKADEFTARFGDTLVRMWEPDTSGGSLANVTREGLLSYLLDFPPMPEWTEAAAQGMPLIVQDEPRWELTSRFTVLVRWSDFGRHVRTHYAVNVTPPILADMAELAGCQVAPTQTQTGRWRAVRRDYLSDEEWRLILHVASVADQQRKDRPTMRIVGGGGRDHPPGEAPASHRAPGATG